LQGNIYVKGDNGFGQLRRQHFAMIRVFQPLPSPGAQMRGEFTYKIQVLRYPAAIQQSMQKFTFKYSLYTHPFSCPKGRREIKVPALNPKIKKKH
jgi:hypothetical protein